MARAGREARGGAAAHKAVRTTPTDALQGHRGLKEGRRQPGAGNQHWRRRRQLPSRFHTFHVRRSGCYVCHSPAFGRKRLVVRKVSMGEFLGKAKAWWWVWTQGKAISWQNNNKYSVSISNTTHTRLIYAFDDEVFRSSSQQPRMLNPTSRLSSPHFTDEKREAQKSHLHKTANLAKFNTEVHKKKLMTLWSSV